MDRHARSRTRESSHHVEVTEDRAEFRKSSYSYGQSNCVEAALAPTAAAVRDSAHRELGALHFPAGEWRAFLRALTGTGG